FLEGGDGGVLEGLAARRDRLAAALRFEAAAGVQRDLDLLEEVRRRRRTLSWVVTRQNFVVLLPTVARDAAHLYAVLGGRLVLEARVTATADLAAAVAFVRQRFAGYQDAPLRREAVDGTPTLAVGPHIVLAQGRPAAPPEEIPDLVAATGTLRPGPVTTGVRYAFEYLFRAGRAQLRREIEAQLAAFAATGLRLAHLEGHLNMHLHPMVLPILLELAPRYRIRAMRLSREDLGAALRYDR